MSKLSYLVVEKNNTETISEKYFDINKENATNYFNTRCEALSKELSGWKAEHGINSCIWSKNSDFKLLYIQVNGIETIDI